MPLGESKSISEEGATWSALADTWPALAELTPLEWESETPESEVDEVLSQCLTSHVPHGWVDGIPHPLPSMALQATLQGLGTGDGVQP